MANRLLARAAARSRRRCRPVVDLLEDRKLLDASAPTTTATVIGTPGNAGYYISPVTVNLSATDPDNTPDQLTTHFSVNGGPPRTGNVVSLPETGTYVVDYYSTDPARNVEPTHSLTVRVDTTAPVITAVASPTSLWPPNHKLVPVTVTGTVIDPGHPGLISAVAYHVIDEYGQVQPSGIVQVAPNGTYSFTVDLQSSRAGQDKDGRHYTISVAAADPAGHTSVAHAAVVVPHDQGHPLIVYQPTTSTFFITGVGVVQFGTGTVYGGNPLPFFADYDGDGQPNLIVYQATNSTFYISGVGAVQFGTGTAYGGHPIPFVADYDGDGKANLIVFEPTTSTFYISGAGAVQLGQGTIYGGDPIPFVGDFNGDGKPDLAVYQPSTSTFYIAGMGAIQFGTGTAYGGSPIPMVDDLDDDGRENLIVFQPTTSTFFITGVGVIQLGQGTAYGGNPIPIIRDFDDDGLDNISVYQPSTSTFAIAGMGIIQFGTGTAYGGSPIPVPFPLSTLANAYVGAEHGGGGNGGGGGGNHGNGGNQGNGNSGNHGNGNGGNQGNGNAGNNGNNGNGKGNNGNNGNGNGNNGNHGNGKGKGRSLVAVSSSSQAVDTVSGVALAPSTASPIQDRQRDRVRDAALATWPS